MILLIRLTLYLSWEWIFSDTSNKYLWNFRSKRLWKVISCLQAIFSSKISYTILYVLSHLCQHRWWHVIINMIKTNKWQCINDKKTPYIIIDVWQNCCLTIWKILQSWATSCFYLRFPCILNHRKYKFIDCCQLVYE